MLLTRILWLRRSKWQFLLAGFAFFIGLCILMTAFDAYLEVNALQERQQKDGQFLILNKKISMVNTMGFESGSFSKAEIDNIRNSGLFQGVGEVYSNKFRAEIFSRDYIRFQSLVFFEAVPRPFLDSSPSDFRWIENSKELPIIVSQDFLNLYNFGFALGQGLPQLGKETLKLLKFGVVVEGPGGRQEFEGRVVGFTERIASVLVPVEFMHWANRTIGAEQEIRCSRIMAKAANAGDPQIAVFLKKFRLVTNQEKLHLGKSTSVLQLVMQGLGLLGFLFSLLALVMFTMNFRLVMAEAEVDIRLLIELGYSHRRIALQLLSWFALLLLILFCAAGIVFIRLEGGILNAISGQGLQAGSGYAGFCLGIGFLFTSLVILWNGILILNHLKKIA